MTLCLILLEEWNNSAVTVILSLFLGLSFLIFLLFWGILKIIPATNNYLRRQRQDNKPIYFLLLILMYALSCVLLFFITRFGLNPQNG
ncbi:MAG: hypothetical protein U0V75_01625 [Ferruginibacter sp.]